MMPQRIQRKRTKGWKMPENTIYVGRPTKWGNPFVVGKPGGAFTDKVMSLRHAWQIYMSVAGDNEALVKAAQTELRGKNLACFCPLPTALYEPDCCHAAVLLEIANRPEVVGGGSAVTECCWLASPIDLDDLRRHAWPITAPAASSSHGAAAQPTPRVFSPSSSPLPPAEGMGRAGAFLKVVT